ncbi:MAG: hypothetical protein ACOZBH_04840 [Patescibacteria group bacterium]
MAKKTKKTAISNFPHYYNITAVAVAILSCYAVSLMAIDSLSSK